MIIVYNENLRAILDDTGIVTVAWYEIFYVIFSDTNICSPLFFKMTDRLVINFKAEAFLVGLS